MSKFGICGFGLIGKQRYQALKSIGIRSENIYVYDPFIDKGQTKVLDSNLKVLDNLENLIRVDPEFVIVATPHHEVSKLISKLGQMDTKILLEKPMGRNLNEAEEIFSYIKKANLSIGFNYRFMPGVTKLKSLLESRVFGEINSINIEVGHGGSPQDIGSWKLNPQLSGGGALLDPGIHLLDLLLFLFPESFTNIEIEGALSWSGFWNTGIDESVKVLGKLGNIPFCLSVSLVSWKTKFRIEVNGNDAYYEISGRGRTDGPQKSVFGKRWGWRTSKSQSASESHGILSSVDTSLAEELSGWLSNDPRVATANDGLRTMSIYDIIKERI